jgi:homoserine dehydrogenase
VMGDVCDIARGTRLPVFGQPAETLEAMAAARSVLPAPYYLRMALSDKPGALARVAAALGEAGVSIDRMRQREHTGDVATVIIVTHKCPRSALDEALRAMDGTGVVQDAPVVLRIEAV